MGQFGHLPRIKKKIHGQQNIKSIKQGFDVSHNKGSILNRLPGGDSLTKSFNKIRILYKVDSSKYCQYVDQDNDGNELSVNS